MDGSGCGCGAAQQYSLLICVSRAAVACPAGAACCSGPLWWMPVPAAPRWRCSAASPDVKTTALASICAGVRKTGCYWKLPAVPICCGTARQNRTPAKQMPRLTMPDVVRCCHLQQVHSIKVSQVAVLDVVEQPAACQNLTQSSALGCGSITAAFSGCSDADHQQRLHHKPQHLCTPSQRLLSMPAHRIETRCRACDPPVEDGGGT